MKRFLLKLILFTVACFVLLNLIAVLYDLTSRRRVEEPGSEIYDAINRSHQPSSCTTIVVGDSVCHQLLTGYAPPGMLSLGTNEAVSMCGQYLIVRSAIEHDPAAKDVILAYQASSFTNNLDQVFTYNYFVRPFYPYAEYRAQMSPLVMQLINRRPMARLVVLPLFRYTTLLTASTIDYSLGAEKPTFTFLAPVSIDYLRKLSELCDQHGIRLHIVSTPINRDVDFDRAALMKEATDAHLETLFASYFETVRLVDRRLLFDEIHFKDSAVNANSAIFIQMLQAESSLKQ
jgi:hypothetical protein